MRNFKHSKKRNSVLLYEFLVRHISRCLIEDKKEEANKALSISKKFFSDGSPLRTELKLFHSILNSTVKSQESARKIVEYACKAAALMNSRMLDEEKSKLIKEINYNLDKCVYDYKIPEYTTCASLQILFNESRNRNKKVDEIEKIKLKDTIISKLTEVKEKPKDSFQVNPEYNNALYRIIVNKFHEKYAGRLTENQKSLLMNYATYMISEDKSKFMEVILREVKRVNQCLSNIKDENILKDKDLMKKLTECKTRFAEIKLANLEEESIIKLLEYIKLTDEVQA
jgi:hypothetical protein